MISCAANSSVVLNITNRCNLRCGFCPKIKDRWVERGCDMRLEREPDPEEIVLAVGDAGRYDEAVFSGLGEPTLRLYVALEAATELRRMGLRTHLVTDGLANLVHGRDVTADLENIVDAVSISLNAHDEMTYKLHCPSELPGAYSAMLDFVERVRYFVPDVTVTAIEGLAGVDTAACRQIANKLGVAFELRPAGVFV